MNALYKVVERTAQGAELVVGGYVEAAGQIAFTFGNVLHGAGHDVQGLQQQADQQAEQGDDRNHGDHRGNHCRCPECVQCGKGLFFVHGQTDRPVDVPQPFDRCKGHDPGFAVGLDLAERAADGRRVLRVNILQVLCDQGFVRVNQDLAVATDQKGIAQAIKVQGIDGVRDGLQAQVNTGHAQCLPGFFHGAANRDNHLTGDRINVRFGQAGTAAVDGVFVPGAGARVETVGHFAVRANGECALVVTKVIGHEGAGQRLLLQQAGGLGGLGVDGQRLCEVFDQQNPPAEPCLNGIGGDTAHLMQVVVEVVADGIALQVIVVQGKERERGYDNQGRSQQDFMTETQVFIHG